METRIARTSLAALVVWALSACSSSHSSPPTNDASPRDSQSSTDTDSSFDGDGSAPSDASSTDTVLADAPWGDVTREDVTLFDAGTVSPPPGVRATQLAAGRKHFCALGSDEAVYCWGNNEERQAAGTRRVQLVPSRVPGLPAISSIYAADNHSCALDHDGGLWCWGYNGYSQLGSPSAVPGDCGDIRCSQTPLRVDIPPADDAFLGRHGTCARDTLGSFHCWGEDPAVRHTPLEELMGAQDLDFGTQHGCALPPSGTVLCFGDAEFGLTGEDGVVNMVGVTSMEVGQNHSCALAADGRVRCWGANWSASLGIADDELPSCRHGDVAGPCSTVPVEPTGVPASRALSVGDARSCVIATTGGVFCWGAWTILDGFSWCNPAEDECDPFPTSVDGTGDAVSVEIGGSVACIIDSRGAVHCWGSNRFGQLGNGSLSLGLTHTAEPVLGFGE